MRCINRISICIALIFCLSLTGCGKKSIPLSFESENTIKLDDSDKKANGFAANIAVTDKDVAGNNSTQLQEEACGGLFDCANSKVLYAKDVHKQMNPASLTKIMTCVVALKYGNLDDIIICSENIHNLESGASTCGLKTGDKITLEQALNFLLIPSANDAAIAIAEHISGSVEEFAKLMTNEAHLLGATNSYFINPHGLTADQHYTTPYDMYLIANEAIKYEKFNEIVAKDGYLTMVRDMNGEEREISVKSSNKFMDGSYHAPDNISILGGKTGTTAAAGSCLVLNTCDSSGNNYIAVILHATERGLLYEQMITLLEEINHR